MLTLDTIGALQPSVFLFFDKKATNYLNSVYIHVDLLLTKSLVQCFHSIAFHIIPQPSFLPNSQNSQTLSGLPNSRSIFLVNFCF